MWFVLLLFTQMVSANSGLPTVVSIKGKVQVLAKTGENMPSMLYEGEKYFYQDARIGLKVNEGALVVCANDARAKLVYPSGSSLWIGPGSMLKVTKVESTAQKESSYLLLIYGRVRSLISKTKDSRFEMRTPTAISGVRGTDFMTSYSAINGTEVSVLSGQVVVTPTLPAKVSPTPPQPTLLNTSQSLRETSQGGLKVDAISKVEVISAYEMTVIPPPPTPVEKSVEPEVTQLESKSKAVVIEELKKSQPELAKALPPSVTPEELNRKVIEKHLEKAKSTNKAPADVPSHDLENYKKHMDEQK